MTRVGWLHDQPGYTGGAELTMAELAAAAPVDVEVVECPAGNVTSDLDAYAIGNCVTYTLQDLAHLDEPTERRIVKFWNDVGSWMAPNVRRWLDEHAISVCCSPLQAEYMGLDDATVIPPPVDLQRFRDAADAVNGERRGSVSVASWRNFGKGPHNVVAWAADHGYVDFFGGGSFAPPGSRQVAYEGMPALLAGYETFVFLPSVIEPFGRCVVEAWAAGLELVVNGLVGAAWWITERPEGLETAAEDFWRTVTGG